MAMFPGLLLMQAAVAITVAQVQALPPQEAGQLIIPQARAAIVAVQPVFDSRLRPPGLTEYDLLEAPQSVAGGCARGRWRANFTGGGTEEGRSLKGVYSTPEVALAASGACPQTGYARINGDLPPAQALAFLATVDAISSGKSKVRIACTSQPDPAFCASDEAIRAGLRSVRPWAVMLSNGVAEIWLGEPGHLATTVKFALARPDEVSVSRVVPPPA